MFGAPFQEGIVFVLLRESDLSGAELIGDELSIAASFANKRRHNEFVLGRTAARRGLAQLGLQHAPAIGVGEYREPLWPEGFVGSISHADGVAAAAVSRRGKIRSLGIDLQPLFRPMRHDISSRIASDAELKWISGNMEKTFMLFSAKESVFKAYFPVCRQYIAFHDVVLTWNGTGFEGEFCNKSVLSQDLPDRFTVQLAKDQGNVLTHVVIEA